MTQPVPPIHQWIIQPMSPFTNDSLSQCIHAQTFSQWPPFRQFSFTNDAICNVFFSQWVPFTNESFSKCPFNQCLYSPMTQPVPQFTTKSFSQCSHLPMTHSANDPHSANFHSPMMPFTNVLFSQWVPFFNESFSKCLHSTNTSNDLFSAPVHQWIIQPMTPTQSMTPI